MLIGYELAMAPAIKIWFFTKDYDVDKLVKEARAEAKRKKLLAEEEERRKKEEMRCVYQPQLCGAALAEA